MSDTQKTASDADVIANLDLLMELDVLESEKDWSLFSAGSSSADAMPSDLDEMGDDK